MKNTYIQIMPSGYGHWKITVDYYGKSISCTTTNSMAIDDYKSDDDKRRLRGLISLRNECISEHKRKK